MSFLFYVVLTIGMALASLLLFSLLDMAQKKRGILGPTGIRDTLDRGNSLPLKKGPNANDFRRRRQSVCITAMPLQPGSATDEELAKRIAAASIGLYELTVTCQMSKLSLTTGKVRS